MRGRKTFWKNKRKNIFLSSSLCESSLIYLCIFILFTFNIFFACNYFRCKVVDYDQIVVAPVLPEMEVKAAQLTEDNSDYSSRKRYHHSKTIITAHHSGHLESD